jgi:LppX_LprAFG lipoprotein
MRTRRTLAAAFLLALPLAAAACGGGGGNSSAPPTVSNLSPVAYVKGAAAKTAGAPSEHVSLKGVADASGQTVAVDGSGDFDQRSHVGSMHVGFSASGMNGTIDEVISGTTIYMRSPLFGAALPQGKTWLKLDLQKAGKAHGVDLSALLSQSPSRSLGQLQGLTKVNKVGTEQIGGDSTTHYRGHVDLSKVPQAARIQALTHAAYTPFDIWVGNDDGYVRRFKFAVAYVVPGGSNAGFSITSDYSDFGKTVKVDEPSAADVLDATNLALPGLGG